MLEKLKNKTAGFNFTKNEKKVIFFITAVVILGGCVKLCQSYFIQAKPYDFSKTDSIFKELSKRHDLAALDTIQVDSSAIREKITTEALTDSLNSNKLNGSSKGGKQEFLKDTKLNINTSVKGDLIKLPGVGEATADKIIEYRTKNPFKKTDDIMKVSGIGIKKFERMKEFIKTEN